MIAAAYDADVNILITGGAGFIGSHAVLGALEAGHTVICVDNLSRGHHSTITTLEALAQPGCFTFVEGNINNGDLLARAMHAHRVDAVMHFAALAYVGESVDEPIRYYRNNTAGTLSLLEAMDRTDVNRIIFSSSCATYGEPDAENIPISEDCPQRPVNPYGRSKLMAELMLRDCLAMRQARQQPFACATLRYFNVAGCDPEARIGEVHDPETHLIPLTVMAALDSTRSLTIHGCDYDTPDGTCVRDYVHVTDLVAAHLRALEALEPKEHAWHAYNIGIGRGYSVREVVESVQRVTGCKVKVVEGPRRPGDPPILFADAQRAQQELSWQPQRDSLEVMIEDTHRWLAKSR